jgi:hypothetical protein
MPMQEIQPSAVRQRWQSVQCRFVSAVDAAQNWRRICEHGARAGQRALTGRDRIDRSSDIFPLASVTPGDLLNTRMSLLNRIPVSFATIRDPIGSVELFATPHTSSKGAPPNLDEPQRHRFGNHLGRVSRRFVSLPGSYTALDLHLL